MRALLSVGVFLALSACPPAAPPNPVPLNQFYFPTGLKHFKATGSTEGVLVVANANFDKRFDQGSLVLVDLDKVRSGDGGLPAFGSPVDATGPRQLKELNIDPKGTVQLASFAGEMASLAMPDGGTRLFLPTRSESHQVFALDVDRDARTLKCVGSSIAGSLGSTLCTGGISLTTFENTETGLPRAPAPVGIATSPAGDVYVTHLTLADSPRGSGTDPRGYLVHLNGFDPKIGMQSFVDLGPGSTNSVVVGSRWAYASGRSSSAGFELVRLVDAASNVRSTGLQSTFQVADARGIALSTDESRLYVVGRAPDSLLISSVLGANSDGPLVKLVRSIGLPEGPTLATVIPRKGRGDLVAITCSTAGVLAIYDDEAGDLVAQVPGVGIQPYAIAVDTRSGGARLFVSNFTDGRVAVIDIVDLDRPQDARIIAHLGDSQLCLTRGSRDGFCDGGTQ